MIYNAYFYVNGARCECTENKLSKLLDCVQMWIDLGYQVSSLHFTFHVAKTAAA